MKAIKSNNNRIIIKMIKLRTICEVYNLQTEVVMVKLYGFDVINRQKEVFAENLTKHMGIKPNELVNRFEIHKVLSSN